MRREWRIRLPAASEGPNTDLKLGDALGVVVYV